MQFSTLMRSVASAQEAADVTALDVVIPAHPKDFRMLDLAAMSARANIAGVRKVFVVSRESITTRLPFVVPIREPDSQSFLTFADVRARWESENPSLAHRAGWIYQQLLSLGAATYIAELLPTYLCINADTLFLRRVPFLIPGTRFVYATSAYPEHQPYLDAYRSLIGEEPLRQSFTVHHMLYTADCLGELFSHIEGRHGKPWYQAYLDAIDYREVSAISEQDIYGSWMLTHHPCLCLHRPLAWKDIPYVPNRLRRRLLSRDLDYVSAHAYMRESRVKRVLSRVKSSAQRRFADVRAKSEPDHPG